jgi:hypothetical protein
MISTVQKSRTPRKKGTRLATIARKITGVWYHNKKDWFMGSTHVSDTALQMKLGRCRHLIALAKKIRPKGMSRIDDKIIEDTTRVDNNE